MVKTTTETVQPAAITEFEQTSTMLNQIFSIITNVYRGYSQWQMANTILVGTLAGKPVLIQGPPGVFKTSIAEFIGSLFNKPVVTVEKDFTMKNEGVDYIPEREMLKYIGEIAQKIGVDAEALSKNLVDGVDVNYTEFGSILGVKIEIDVLKHPGSKDLGTAKDVPITVYIKTLTNLDEPQDILGTVIDHPIMLGRKPPHVEKKGRMLGADLAILDEAFKGPMLLAQIHRILNEGYYDTAIGRVEYRPLTIILATNPLNEHFQSNVALTDAATFDRYAFSTMAAAPSVQEIKEIIQKLEKLKGNIRPVPIEIIYKARQAAKTVKIDDGLETFLIGMISHLSRCYYSPTKQNRVMESFDPFMVTKDCDLCAYKSFPCSKGNVTKVRPIIVTTEALKILALINKKQTATTAELEPALIMTLSHRVLWNSNDFLIKYGDQYRATAALVKEYVEQAKLLTRDFKIIRNVWVTKDISEALKLRNQYIDQLIIRSILDEAIDMIKETAKKKGDTAILEQVNPQIDFSGAISALTDKPQGGNPS